MDNNGQQWIIMDNTGQHWTTMDNNPLCYMHLWCRFDVHIPWNHSTQKFMNSPLEWIDAVLLVTHVTIFSILCKNVVNAFLFTCTLNLISCKRRPAASALSPRQQKKKLQAWGQLWLDCWVSTLWTLLLLLHCGPAPAAAAGSGPLSILSCLHIWEIHFWRKIQKYGLKKCEKN